ncbi:COG3179 Predicted chitinase [uncultured Caudovirales phage]|uniref:COG3179 Predicted chitinase n=1 Tax=uncultured Caudovirales phage TaxID=2100421 RepID=A0A6J5KXS8_9CAUD|nr:COG3179 Predicted chitinase [uncultured Caudovirales phage]
MLTIEQIKKILPNNKKPESLTQSLNSVLPNYNINTKERIACFLAQCAHESGEFNRLTENLNYSGQGLCGTWPKRFPSLTEALPYDRNPEMIANKVYCDRMGNGPESSGDGWKYRGRGCIQLTGKLNYTKFAKYIGKSLEETILYCETLQGAIESGCYFWKVNNLNQYCDNKDFVGLTKAINGGETGYDDRLRLKILAISIL